MVVSEGWRVLETIKSFHELKTGSITPAVLQEEIAAKGYVLIRGLLPKDDVRTVLADVTRVLSSAKWLASGCDPGMRMVEPGISYGDPDPAFKAVYQEVFNLESFHSLPHQPAIRRLMKMIVGDQLLVHPKPIGRLIFPNSERLVVRAHQDYEFMGGDPEFFTAWIPLHDCPVEVGPLRILEGSHHSGIQQHQRDGLHVPEIPIENTIGEGWVGGRLNAGDVLIFHSLTVHAASPNLSEQMRISLDCRFQDARRILNPSNLVFAGESRKSWEKTYSGWRSDEFQYYWKKMALTFRPSTKELEQLAQTSDSPSARAKYARMVRQLI